MSYNIPNNKGLSTNKLASVFNNTSASYKFYWFISLLQIISNRDNNDKIPLKNILIKMICNAWYPIVFFKLNFGYSDKLSENIGHIQKQLNVPVDIPVNELFILLQNSTNAQIIKLIIHFEQLVPYRFLSPWIKGSKNEVIMKSQDFTENCLYSLHGGVTKAVEINPDWSEYLIKNNKILLDFSYWNLLKYLQVRNPNVPSIGNKLIKPIIRGSLNKQRNFWNIILSEMDSFHCIYTGKELHKNLYDIEHFIPWSFVSHDQLWNLIPADSSVNSSKSNKLPSMEKYFDSFVRIQFEALKIAVHIKPKTKLLEDYLVLGSSLNDIIQKPYPVFKEKYYKLISPLMQIANNSGFEYWKR